MESSQVLIVDGRSEAAGYIQGSLPSSAVAKVQVASWPDALGLLGAGRFGAVVIDLDDAPTEGRRFLAAIQRETPTTPVIIVADVLEQPGLAECGAAGAFEVLSKPLDRAALLAVLHRALTWSQLCAGDPLAPRTPARGSGDKPFPEIIGDSDAMQEVYHWVHKVAPADANVCLHGESGTGKELVARAIHDCGRRRGRPFVVLDCAAIPEGLMESEMFGHVRGAFTSAVGDRVGVFQLADTGTLFLDEVGELTFPLQAKLLRVIQNREFRRVGSSHPLRVDVRIIAATNRDLAALVKQGRFREDLFYRLDVISITLPPLRKRKEDIPLLVEHFVEAFNRQSTKQIRGVTARTLRHLLQYDWPGNVRELQNCVERAAILADGAFIDIAHLHQILHPAQAGAAGPAGDTLRERERAMIRDALRQTRGNKTAAAALLGISIRGLHYKLKRLEKDRIRTETG
ncbi:MAG: sigma-54 dependent transcriptional regulator [Candidatus Methylomirabilales bacterium]